ncbi:hypothetical protein V8C35DRAFT_283438 [Trichoderma chlorosporum]
MSSSQTTEVPSVASHSIQQPGSYLRITENTNDNHQPTDLFLAVSHAAAQRQRESAQQRERQEHLQQKWEEEHVLKPQRAREEEEKAKEKTEKLVAELFEKELEAWREQRDKASARNGLSRAEVDEKVRRLVEAVLQGAGMEKRRMEDGTEEPHEEWRGRMIVLRKEIYRVWNHNEGRIRMGLPRYVEGYPVREGIYPPKFMPGKRQRMSGLGGCLQCEVKGLACSKSVQGRGSGEELKKSGCKRCRADGDRCIVSCEFEDVEEGQEEGKEEEKKKKVSHGWDWWDGAPDRGLDTDSVAEAVEMWERRRRGARLETIGGVMQWVEVGGFALPRPVDKEE